MERPPADALTITGTCRTLGVFIYWLAGIAILLVPLNLIVWFFAGWAAVCGDTGCPMAPGSDARLECCLVFTLAAGSLALPAIVTAPFLPVSVSGLKLRRVALGCAMIALALDLSALILLTGVHSSS